MQEICDELGPAQNLFREGGVLAASRMKLTRADHSTPSKVNSYSKKRTSEMNRIYHIRWMISEPDRF